MTLWQRVRLFAKAFILTARDTGLAIRHISAPFWVAMVAVAAAVDVILLLVLGG